MTKMKYVVAGVLAALMVPTTAAFGDAGDWIVRARAIHVSPDEGASINPIGGDASIDTATTAELDFTYFVTDKLALELILATTKHSPVAVGTAAGDVPLGSVWLLPPTLTLQYHPLAGEGISPYVGAGVNYTVFYNESLPTATVTDIDYSNEFSLALQAGVDFAIDENWIFNVDVKKLFLGTDVSINGGAITADVDIDPWIFGAGIGYRF